MSQVRSDLAIQIIYERKIGTQTDCASQKTAADAERWR